MRLDGKVAVVTGGARGIGRAIAGALAARGASIAIVDRDAVELEQARSALADAGHRATAHAADVGREPDVVAAMDAVVAAHGRLDVLVNNAGIIRDALLVKAKDGTVVSRMSLAQWQAVIDVNLTGVFLCGREAAAHMIGLGHGGVIVNVSSISKAGNPGQTNYAAAKAGVEAMTVTWARELARHGIRVAAVAPGFTRTALLEGMPAERLAQVTAPVPLGRLAEPEEIAAAVMFVVDNGYYTGRTLEVDGGLRF
ncbi:MAG: SDR family oxidoreductase [Steroidobacteraceae bacterium]